MGTHRKRRTSHKAFATFVTAAMVLTLAQGFGIGQNVAEAAVSVVTNQNMSNWSFFPTGGGSGALVNGPATPPRGTGSLMLSTGGNGNNGFQARNNAFSGTLLTSITQLRYSTYIANNSTTQAPYLVLDIDYDSDADVDDRLFFEPGYQTGSFSGAAVPNQGAVADNTWQEWNALTGGWWSDNAPVNGPPLVTLAQYATTHTGAMIINSSAGNLGGIRIAAGFGGASWNNFSGNVDAFAISVSGNETIYDFERSNVSVACSPYADGVQSFAQGDRKNGSDVPPAQSDATEALGAPDDDSVTLGLSGSIVLRFDEMILNTAGNDVRIHEETNGVSFPLERAHVYASMSATGSWTLLGTAISTGSGITDLDLGSLSAAQYIRLHDFTDPAIHASSGDGFDLDAVHALHLNCTPPSSSSASSISSSTGSSISSSSLSSSTGSSLSSSSLSSSTGSSLSSSSQSSSTGSSISSSFSTGSSVSSSSVSSSTGSSVSSSSSSVIAGVPTCNGIAATIYVDANGEIVGGPDDGEEYDGDLRGTSRRDIMVGTNEEDDIRGRSGNDVICGMGGDDEIDGGIGNDQVAGENGADELDGGIGVDLVCGGAGDDEIDGGSSPDNLDGGAGSDEVDGSNGRDTCRNGDEYDSCEDTAAGSIAACSSLTSGGTPAM